jgi:hypothetical protein
MRLNHAFRPDPPTDFSPPPEAIAAEATAAGTDANALTWQEASAVMIGCKDAFRFGWQATTSRSFVARKILAAIRFMIGIKPVRPLADERLEMLRQLGCMVRRKDPRLEMKAAELRARGVSATALQKAIALARSSDGEALGCAKRRKSHSV